MRGKNSSFILAMLVGVLVLASFSASSINIDNTNISKAEEPGFYFVQITDTHVEHKTFDRFENSKMRLTNVLENISNFKEKPAFVAITGDLVEWGGSSSSGALNFQAFVNCLYEDEGQFYADSDFTIPVYTTPGNHDYVWENKLTNYHRYVKDVSQYTITYGDASFFFMDSGANYILEPWDWTLILGAGLYDEDILWLEGKLSTCQSNYKIILMHHPAVSTRDEVGRMKDTIARNRDSFIDLCEEYDVELVLAGHTHNSRVFDVEEERYDDFLPLNCNDYQTLYVQTNDCKEGIHYRNISISNDGVVLEKTQELEYNPITKSRTRKNLIMDMIIDILKNRQIDIFKYI